MMYQYKAVNRSGELQSGFLEASSVSSAVIELGRRSMVPLELKPSAPALSSFLLRTLKFGRSLSSGDLVTVTQNLASLLKAGLTLDRALHIIGVTSERRSVRQLCSDLETRVRSGHSLSEALGEHRESLPDYFIAMTCAGEAGGSLPEGLERLSRLLERSAQVRERIVTALIYPAMLAGMIGLTLIMVLTVVLPRFRALFEESRVQVPWITRAVLALGEFVSSYGWVAAMLALAAFAGLYGAWRHPVHGHRLSAYLLKAGWTFGIVRKTQSSRFLRTLGTLARNGTPLPDAMAIASGTLSNRAMTEAAQRMHVELKQGRDLSSLLDQVGVFPKAAVQLARVGEESGQLEALLIEAADGLDRDAQGTLDRLLSVMVPAITIVMGAFVAGLIASVLVGILSLNDLAF